MEPTPRPVIQIRINRVLVYLLGVIMYLPLVAFILSAVNGRYFRVDVEILVKALLMMLLPALFIFWIVRSYTNDKKRSLIFAVFFTTLFLVATISTTIGMISNFVQYRNYQRYEYDIRSDYPNVVF